MNLGLEGRVALVTGGAAGIGAAVVKLLSEEGARVVIVDRNRVEGERLVDGLRAAGCPCHFVPCELTQEEDCRRAVAEAEAQWGRLDIVVNNAGVNDGIGLDHSPDAFMASLRLNLFHVFAITHYARAALQSARGAIVNISSKVSVTGQGATSGYAAAKGGINALTREWAAALAPAGVRVNCVFPAECDTPQYERWFESLPDPVGTRRAIEGLIPLGRRFTRADELAAAVVFLASERASHMTGQFLFVDGGYTHLDRALSQSHHKWAT